MIGLKIITRTKKGYAALNQAIIEGEKELSELTPEKQAALNNILSRKIIFNDNNILVYRVKFIGKIAAQIKIIKMFSKTASAQEYINNTNKQLEDLKAEMINAMKENGAMISIDYNIEAIE